jgi:HD superfamily phosphodiesterase
MTKLLNYETHIIKRATEFAKTEYKKNELLHGWGHIENVMRRTSEIIEKLDDDIDYESLKLAIIFHDIDYNSEESPDKNYENHVDNSIKVADNFLRKNDYPIEKIKRIKQIILDHSGPHRRKFGEAKSIEGKIIYDSDKSISINTHELHKKYFPWLYLDETKEMVK